MYFIDRENVIEADESKRKSKFGEPKKTRRSYLIQRTSVADPDPHRNLNEALYSLPCQLRNESEQVVPKILEMEAKTNRLFPCYIGSK